MSLESLANQHRNAILAREAAAASQIDSQYKGAWSRILARLHWLFAQMQQAEHTGQTINIGWLYEANRLQQALSQIHAEISAFSQQANTTVQGQVTQAQRAGQQDANLLLGAQLGKIGVQFNQPQPQALVALSQSLDSGPIANRFAQMPADAVRRVKGTLLAAIAAGSGPREAARQVREDIYGPKPAEITRQIQQQLSKELSDALRISRTEMMQAYRDGTMSIYRANSDVVTGWTWLAELDACPRCAAKDGSQHDLGEDFEGLHPNCRCTATPRTVSYEDILAA